KMRTLSDPELYALEMKKIFAKTWVFLGHETEIPNKGDFIVRDMGSDSVIVARSSDEQIHVSLNACPHRGMTIATADGGHAAAQLCSYAGWTFGPNGDFVVAPMETACMRGKMRTRPDLGLHKAPVSIYGGLIFATWNIDGPSVEDCLGDAKWYFDR